MKNIAFGINSIQEILKADSRKIKEVSVIKSEKHRLKKIILEIKNKKIPVTTRERKWISNKIGEKTVHQGIFATLKTNKKQLNEEDKLDFILNKKTMTLLLILDNITDTRNMGACLRSAEAAGVDAVIIQKKRAAKINAICLKAASGATEYVSIIKVTNLSRIIRLLKEKEIQVIGTECKAEKNIYNINMAKPTAIVIGNEEKGIRRIIKQHCTKLMKIPMGGHIQSLNASVASSICLFEAVRQRKFKL